MCNRCDEQPPTERPAIEPPAAESWSDDDDVADTLRDPSLPPPPPDPRVDALGDPSPKDPG